MAAADYLDRSIGVAEGQKSVINFQIEVEMLSAAGVCRQLFYSYASDFKCYFTCLDMLKASQRNLFIVTPSENFKDMRNSKACQQTIFQKILVLRSGETVLILSDGTDPELCRQLLDISHGFGAVATVMQIKKSMGAAGKNFYMKFLHMPSVIISVMADPFPPHWKKKILESQKTRLVDIRAFGKKAQTIISQTSYHRLNAISQKIKDILSIGHQLNITTTDGSDFQLDPASIHPINQSCPIVKSGDVGELPAGKLCFSVAPGTGDGVLIIDSSIAPLGAVSEPVRLKLNNGTIRRISGKKSATELRYLFKKNGSVSRQLLSIGFGTNEAVNPTAITEYGEYVAGNMFLTFGAPGAADTLENPLVRVLLTRPTVVIDGKTFLENGRFMMSFSPIRTADNQHISAVGNSF